MPETDDNGVAVAASTWMQVVFSGLGVGVAIVGLVIAYFAWIKPHSPDTASPPAPTPAGPAATGATTTGPATPAAVSGGTPLGTYQPIGGRTALSDVDGGIAVQCPSNQSGDKQQAVQYDLPKDFARFGADLTVDGDDNPDQQFQLKVLAAGEQVDNVVFRDGENARTDANLKGARDLRLEVTCENADARLILLNPVLSTT